MKKVIILLADGLEEIEALTQVDYFRRINIEIDMVSISNNLTITGDHNIIFKAEKFLDNIDLNEYDGIIIPGGMAGVEKLMESNEVLKSIKYMDDEGKMVAAICAGPLVLDKAGVLYNRKFTCYTGIEKGILNGKHTRKPSMVDENIITAAGPAYAQKFSFEIINYLEGKDKVKELKDDILYKKFS